MQVELGPEDAARAERVRAAVGARSVTEVVRVAMVALEAGLQADPGGPWAEMVEAVRKLRAGGRLRELAGGAGAAGGEEVGRG